MRIALLQPTYWPEVRRGSERLVHDLGVALARRGHEVTLITSHAGRTTDTPEEGVRVIRGARPPQLGRLRRLEDHVANIPGVALRLLRGQFDLAHAFFGADAWAAVQARRLGGPPVVFSFHGIVARSYLIRRRYRLEMLREAIRRSAATTVLSDAAAKEMRRYLQVDPVVLSGGVFAADFELEAERDPRPTLICAASLRDHRKRAGLLLSAFEELRRRRPEARLLLVRPRDPMFERSDPESADELPGLYPDHVGEPVLPDGADWIDADRTVELAHAYATSWASVLPAVNEAFGLVILESLAAGTPVVAARSGACPEVLTDEGIGRLFEPDDEASLVEALEAALELAQSPETVASCRARAAEYDWGRVAHDHEQLYLRVAR